MMPNGMAQMAMSQMDALRRAAGAAQRRWSARRPAMMPGQDAQRIGVDA